MTPASANVAASNQSRAHVKNTARLAAPIVIFLIAQVLPWTVELGSFGLTPARLLLLAMLVPCLIAWANKETGEHNTVDWLVLMLCLWTIIALAVTEGIGNAIESGGMIAVETAGPYFLARRYIRSASDFKSVVRILFLVALVLLPFAVVEALTGQNVIMALFGAILPTVSVSYDGLRWGLKRVQSVYEHPILFGVCTGMTLALVNMILGRDLPAWKRWLATLLVGATAFLSMSSGPIGAIVAQIALMTWARFTTRIRYNWLLLGGFVLSTFVVIEFGSNQSVPQFYISRFSFDRETAWLRLLIWEFGSASVMDHPLFGIGFASWARPGWMSDSIDMFWMAGAIRYGIPGGALLLSLPLATIALISSARLTDPEAVAYRVAYLIVIVSFLVVGWTVHFWGTAYLLFLFLLGSGEWLRALPANVRLSPSVRRGGVGVAHLGFGSVAR